MERIWNSILEFIGRLVSPDWAGLIALLPIIVLLAVVAYLVWIVLRFAKAGPTHHGGDRLEPRPPADVHLPGPSYGPIVVAVGALSLFFGIVFGGTALAVGAVIMVLALLFWGREAMRDFDRIEPEDRIALPDEAHAGPPAGVHLPGPSFRPIISGLAMMILVYGLVFGGALLAAGAIIFAISLVQWLIDARGEYTAVEAADATGHLDSGARPRYPKKTLASFAILVAAALVVQSGAFPPGSTAGGSSGGTTSGSSAAPGASSGSTAPAPTNAADVSLAAQNLAFVPTQLTGPAGRPFTMAFTNDDPGIPHNVAIRKDSPAGAELFKGAIFPGVAARVYNVPALPAGQYAFICDVHPTMTGTLTIP
jgi:plastocyanin